MNPECRLYLSDAEKELFRNNNVLIRGAFDTSAEAFARENHLRFLHIDTVIAREGDYFERGIDILTLCFYQDGSAYINQDEKCQGISAGNTGGGEVKEPLNNSRSILIIFPYRNFLKIHLCYGDYYTS